MTKIIETLKAATNRVNQDIARANEIRNSWAGEKMSLNEIPMRKLADDRPGYNKYVLEFIFGDVHVLYSPAGHTLVSLNADVDWWPKSYVMKLDGEVHLATVQKIIIDLTIAYKRGFMHGDTERVKKVKEALCMQ